LLSQKKKVPLRMDIELHHAQYLPNQYSYLCGTMMFFINVLVSNLCTSSPYFCAISIYPVKYVLCQSGVIYRGERSEAFLRIIIGIISGLILSLWKTIVQILVIIHWIYVVFTGKRNKELADFCNIFNTQKYRYLRYMTFATNERPFPFTPLGKVRDEVKIVKK